MFNVYETFKKDGKQFLVFSAKDRFDCEVWITNHSCDWATVVRGDATFLITDSDRKFKVGDIVRFSEGWCSEGEKHLLMVVTEDRTNDIGERYLVHTLNHTNAFGHSETVFSDMIDLVMTAEESKAIAESEVTA